MWKKTHFQKPFINVTSSYQLFFNLLPVAGHVLDFVSPEDDNAFGFVPGPEPLPVAGTVLYVVPADEDAASRFLPGPEPLFAASSAVSFLYLRLWHPSAKNACVCTRDRVRSKNIAVYSGFEEKPTWPNKK